jgi:hypothetical protein
MFGAVNVLKSEEAEDSTESELDIFQEDGEERKSSG